MGRTNDAILYGGRVHLSVRGSDDAARDSGQRLPSGNSRDYGRSFADIFKDVRVRLLQDRPGAVRAGRGVGQQPRQRPHLARRRARHGAAAAACGWSDLTAERRRAVRVAIMTDETGWHTRQLQAALRARGVAGRCVDLADCRIDTTAAWHGLVIPGFGRELPDAVLVRGIAGGSFEQVTLRLGVLHALREFGVPVYNDARAIERSVDKSMTSLLLHAAGIPTPPTWAIESAAQAQRVRDARERGRPRAGAQAAVRLAGQGPAAASARSTACTAAAAAERHYGGAGLPAALRAAARRSRASTGACWWSAAAPSPRCAASASTGCTTWRRARAAWRAPLEPALARLAERAARALDLDYAGVDMMPGAERRDRCRCSRSTASPPGRGCSA